ncbi:DUF423 domain-containing protein [Luteimonas sp. MJ293]|uniref:DUF423 domain-containing protein n=1 Tax=Luteimonas sp. MJ146 TaxID=3129240 RepID=UPI0031BAEFE2
MTVETDRPGAGRLRSILAALGALCAGLAVAMAAYASHGVDGAAQAWLQTAALFAFGHGVALALLAPLPARRLRLGALLLLFAGMLLFSGSLAGAALLGWPTAAAPLGGSLMILGWLTLAADLLRD